VPPPKLTAVEFSTALKEAGFGVEHARIIEVSGRCPGFVTTPAFRGRAVDRPEHSPKRSANAMPRLHGGPRRPCGLPNRRPAPPAPRPSMSPPPTDPGGLPTCGRTLSFLCAGGDAILSAQSGGAKVMRKNSKAAQLRDARKAWIAHADERAAKLAPIIKALQAKGVTSLSGIADALNKRRIRTARGVGLWQATQVARVMARMPA
jgi:hypothetical protein